MGKGHRKNPNKRQLEKETSVYQENKKTQKKHQKLCLLFTEPEAWSLTMLIVEESGDCLSSDSFSTMKLPGYCFPDVGFGSLGSKCYVIGGDVYPHGKPLKGLKLPRKVLICDLNNTIRSWEEGPMLIGGKPNPIIVTVNGKLYALAGNSDLWKGPHEKLTTIFEVFEPKYNMWRVLPKPPFFSLYKKGFPHPKFRGNTVIGSVIYLTIEDNSDSILYSFNVDSERWTEYTSGSDGSSYEEGSDDIVIHNLTVADWFGATDVVDYLMFRTTGRALERLNVYAYDLSCNIVHREEDNNRLVFIDEDDTSEEEVMDYYFWGLENDLYFFDDESLVSLELMEREEDIGEGDDSTKEGEHSFRNRDGGDINNLNKYKRHDYEKEQYVLTVDDKSLTIPVYGLTHIDRFIYPTSSLTSCVTHLGGNLFSLILSCPYRNYEGKRLAHVRVCIFETSFIELSDGLKLKERYVACNNVRESKWMEPDMESLVGWCKVPNDGLQSQFRRPQLQYGKTSSGYPDYVAGKIIEKKNTFHRYVRRVNLPQ